MRATAPMLLTAARPTRVLSPPTRATLTDRTSSRRIVLTHTARVQPIAVGGSDVPAVASVRNGELSYAGNCLAGGRCDHGICYGGRGGGGGSAPPGPRARARPP